MFSNIANSAEVGRGAKTVAIIRVSFSHINKFRYFSLYARDTNDTCFVEC